MRRLLASATLAALGLSLAVPLASAHNERYVHEMSWGASPDPTTANNGAQVWSNDEIIAAKVFFTDGVKSWDVVIRPVNGGPPSTCHEDLAQEKGDYPQTVYINCPWDTTRAKNHTLPQFTTHANAGRSTSPRVWQTEDLGPSSNGKYTIEITVNNTQRCGVLTCTNYKVEPHHLYQDPDANPPRWREVWVVNGASKPTGVTNSYDSASNKITVSWARNPEPDVSYIVQEKVGDGKWSSGATVPGTTTRYERAIEKPGKYQYRVAAVRPAPTSNSGSGAAETKRSDYVATQAVEIAQVTPPATAGSVSPDVPAEGGGEPGVFVPTDPTTTTTAGSGAPTPPKASSGARRPGGGAARPRPPGSTSRSSGSSNTTRGEAEGEGPDEGFSSFLPYTESQEGFADLEEFGDDEEAAVIPGELASRTRDTRQTLTFLAASLAMFVFAMQVTVFLRRRPAVAGVEDDFEDWMGYSVPGH